MIAPDNGHGKGFISTVNATETGKKRHRPITKTLKAPTITPYFRQSPVTLDWDNASVASKARSGSISGFLSPPAPRGSADRAKLSSA
jgi:hypothetical protein